MKRKMISLCLTAAMLCGCSASKYGQINETDDNGKFGRIELVSVADITGPDVTAESTETVSEETSATVKETTEPVKETTKPKADTDPVETPLGKKLIAAIEERIIAETTEGSPCYFAFGGAQYFGYSEKVEDGTLLYDMCSDKEMLDDCLRNKGFRVDEFEPKYLKSATLLEDGECMLSNAMGIKRAYVYTPDDWRIALNFNGAFWAFEYETDMGQVYRIASHKGLDCALSDVRRVMEFIDGERRYTGEGTDTQEEFFRSRTTLDSFNYFVAGRIVETGHEVEHYPVFMTATLSDTKYAEFALIKGGGSGAFTNVPGLDALITIHDGDDVVYYIDFVRADDCLPNMGYSRIGLPCIFNGMDFPYWFKSDSVVVDDIYYNEYPYPYIPAVTVPVFEQMDESSSVKYLDTEDICHLSATDGHDWIFISSEDGVSGWMKVRGEYPLEALTADGYVPVYNAFVYDHDGDDSLLPYDVIDVTGNELFVGLLGQNRYVVETFSTKAEVIDWLKSAGIRSERIEALNEEELNIYYHGKYHVYLFYADAGYYYARYHRDMNGRLVMIWYEDEAKPGKQLNLVITRYYDVEDPDASDEIFCAQVKIHVPEEP